MESLPTELLTEIIRYVLLPRSITHRANERSFENAASLRDVSVHRAALLRASRELACIAYDVSAQHVQVSCQEELQFFIAVFGKGVALAPWHESLGNQTRRIDFAVSGTYKPSDVAQLLSMTPRLSKLIFNNRTPDFPRRTPEEIVHGICVYGQGVRTLEFRSLFEVPNLHDLAGIIRGLPHLESLRMDGLHPYPSLLVAIEDEGRFPQLPKLTTLSLGPYRGWSPLLHCLSDDEEDLLPALTTIQFAHLPSWPSEFFRRHGRKIQTMRAGVESEGLCAALGLCDALETLIVAIGPWTLELPSHNRSIRRICVIPTPIACITTPVVQSLEKLLGEIISGTWWNLEEVQIWNANSWLTTQPWFIASWSELLRGRGVSIVCREYDEETGTAPVTDESGGWRG
ncbi:hypothetical protein NMY22_g7516 [Coprinellus aureogranulatus]|nr:hypothetical protein NMY22_g7516 [Coprinellus aureogranulatus]